MTLTDLPELMPLLRHNIVLNSSGIRDSGGLATEAELRWGSPVPAELVGPELVILSDCVFEEPAIPLLMHTLEQMCNSHTTVLCAIEQREHPANRAAELAFNNAAAQQFVIERLGHEEQDPDYVCDEIVVLRMRTKS